MDYSMGKPPSTVKNEKTVKYMKNWISTTISIVALGIAIVAMAKVAPAHELDFDYYGAIIGVLSFLVTLLMGYQIYTVINVKKDMDEVRIVKKEIDTKLQEKAQALSKEYRDELSQAVPLLITISSPDREVIETAAFRVYKESKPEQFAKELAGRTIYVMLEGLANQEEDVKKAGIEELSKNIKYDEAVEYYTDFAKKERNGKDKVIELFLLDLIGTLAERK